MAPTPLAIGQKLTKAPPSGGGGNLHGDKKISINQSGNSSFPHVMKKLKAKADDQSRDTSAGVSSSQNTQTVDASLPPNGTLLPLNLPQVKQDTQTDPTSKAKGQVDPKVPVPSDGQNPQPIPIASMLPATQEIAVHEKGKIEPDKANKRDLQPPMVLGDKTASAAAKQPVIQLNANSATNTEDPSSTADATSSQTMLKTAFSSLLVSTQNNQASPQVLQQGLAGNILDKHVGLLGEGSSHGGLDVTNGLSQLTSGADKINQPTTLPPPISAPLKSPQWGEELSNRVVWMTQHDVQSANFKINPPHLGPLEVHVSMHKDQVDVTFHAHHAGVQAALDSSMPKLKEMLGSSGLQLGDANVAQHSFSGHSNNGNPNPGQQVAYSNGAGVENAVTDVGVSIGAESLLHGWDSGAIDFYA